MLPAIGTTSTRNKPQIPSFFERSLLFSNPAVFQRSGPKTVVTLIRASGYGSFNTEELRSSPTETLIPAFRNPAAQLLSPKTILMPKATVCIKTSPEVYESLHGGWTSRGHGAFLPKILYETWVGLCKGLTRFLTGCIQLCRPSITEPPSARAASRMKVLGSTKGH